MLHFLLRGVLVGVLALLLGGEYLKGRAIESGPGAQIGAEISAVFQSPDTQWVLVAGFGVYMLGLMGLRCRQGLRVRGLPAGSLAIFCLFVFGFLALASYGLDYAEGSRTASVPVLIGGVALGQAVGLWLQWERRHHNGSTVLQTLSMACIGLLALASVTHINTSAAFHYRGQERWSGPWTNPNTFGILMGVGIVLAMGQMMQNSKTRKQAMLRREPRSRELDLKSSRNIPCTKKPVSTTIFTVRLAFLIIATGLMMTGLIRSYSRGAWVATGLGLAYLGWKTVGASACEFFRLSSSRQDRWGVAYLRRNGLSLALFGVSAFALAFWHFRHADQPLIRRVFSFGNSNDFSWRNRVAAWEGTLQMMGERPWLGHGWNKAELIYNLHYRPSTLAEGMAFQTNDYFMIGTTLGIPALICLGGYVVLRLSAKQKSQTCQLENTLLTAANSARWRVDVLGVSCRSGTILLLLGFWFDGGLLKLAVGPVFWMLLELGSSDLCVADQRAQKAIIDARVCAVP